MTDLTVHTVDTAPEASKPLLEKGREELGFLPNLLGELAEAPAALGAYLDLHAQFSGSSLSAAEQQVVLLATSFENECHYCMAAHTGGAKQAGLADEHVEALRAGEPLSDPKLEALRRFTAEVTEKRGWVDDAVVNRFLGAGYSKGQLLEVLVGVTQKTLSNYANHIAGTELDPELQPAAWEKPAAVAG